MGKQNKSSFVSKLLVFVIFAALTAVSIFIENQFDFSAIGQLLIKLMYVGVVFLLDKSLN